jgi:hypothetical protein
MRPGDPGPFLLVDTRERESEITSHFAEVHPLGSIVIPLFTRELRRFDLDRLAGYRGDRP